MKVLVALLFQIHIPIMTETKFRFSELGQWTQVRLLNNFAILEVQHGFRVPHTDDLMLK